MKRASSREKQVIRRLCKIVEAERETILECHCLQNADGSPNLARSCNPEGGEAMNAPLPTAALDFDLAHACLDQVSERYFARAHITVSVISINHAEGGQLVLCDERHDKREVARRLRVAADALEKQVEITT